jgi:hypothetical protein
MDLQYIYIMPPKPKASTAYLKIYSLTNVRHNAKEMEKPKLF